MLQYDFDASIGYWICMTSHVYQQRLNGELAPFGITFRQFQVLAWLAYEDKLSQAQLAERLMVEPPTLAGILDRMQREGWIERRGCQDDRRRKHVCLQPGARRVWAQIVGCLKSLRCQASRGLSDEEVQLLEQLLRKVRANLSEPSAVASSLREQHVTGATS